MGLKRYEDVQKDKVSPPQEPTPSGVACTERGCDGEMMYIEPRQKHPEMPELARAICGKCGWRGWV